MGACTLALPSYHIGVKGRNWLVFEGCSSPLECLQPSKGTEGPNFVVAVVSVMHNSNYNNQFIISSKPNLLNLKCNYWNLLQLNPVIKIIDQLVPLVSTFLE